MMMDSDEEYPAHVGEAYLGHEDQASSHAVMTTKIPPAYNGRTSWFAYEELIDEWVDLTIIAADKQGPNLRNRLIEDAQMYKPLLDRNRLMDPAEGVQYFKDTMRPHFVKGKEHVFLWRFLLFFRCYRANQDMTRWIGRFIITRKRLLDAWMDLFPEYTIVHERYLHSVQTTNVARAARNEPPLDPTQQFVFDEWLANERRKHTEAFPLNDHLVTMMFIVAADLSESQRERLVSTMSVRGIQLAQYTFEVISSVFREIFCATKTSIADPNLRPTTMSRSTQRSFCILDEGDWDGDFGLWVQDDDTGEEGFVNFTDQVFWTYDDTSAAYVARPTPGRAFRKGWPKYQPRKGKGKGSRGRFRSFRKGKGKGRKGKGKGYYGEEDQDTSYFGKGGKGKKGKKGKKGFSQDGDSQKGKGKSESLQVKTEPTRPEPSAASNSDSFWSESDTWWTNDVWWTDDSSWDNEYDWSYLVIERTHDESPEHSALLSSFSLIDIRKNPTYVILDSGCTRCLGSRPRVMAFVHECRSRGTNMKFEFVPCQTKFSFANSRTSKVYERLVIHFDTQPPCKTEIDILEEGAVPILLSIQQMRSLYMTFEHTPECDYLTCKAFGFKRHPLPISNTNHIVLDLAALKQNPRIMLTSGIDDEVLFSRTAHVVNDSAFNANEFAHPAREEPQKPVWTCPACRGQKRKHTRTVGCKHEPAEVETGLGQPIPAVEKKQESEQKPKKTRADYDTEIVGSLKEPESTPSTSSSSVKLRMRAKTPSAHVESPDQGDSSSSRAPAVSPPEAEAAPPPGVVLPLAIDRIRQRLDNDVELHKLHLKHHHMSTIQFKQRTSALKLPTSIYQRYDGIVKACEVCQKVKRAPERSRVSGMRAEVFGELLFIDHGEFTEENQAYLFFIILDGATNLVTAFVQRTKDDQETQENLREHMHQLQFRPKAIVGDQAFHTPAWETFYRTRGIKPIGLGPGTPWPNRAETAVRLFKHQVKLMFAEIKTNPIYRSITPRELFREACWARNVSVTYGGKTPLELAFGRRPPDVLDVETSSPQILTHEGLPADEHIKKVQQLAMRCHLQARQANDLRQDIASSLRFSHGPFVVGDKVWYYDVDTSKIKSGRRDGKWTRAKVIGVDGSMVGIDLGNRIIRVNESKLRKDHDHFGDINVPLEPDVSAASDSAHVDHPPGLPQSDDAASTLVPDGSVSFAHVLWQVLTKGKINVLELFAGSARISQCSAQEGLSVGQPVDLRTGFDLNTSQGQRMTMQLISDQQPDVVFMAPVCAPWCQWSHMKPHAQKLADRRKVMPMVQFVIRVAKYQLSRGKYFIIENPYGSDLWKLPEYVELLSRLDVSYGQLDMCAYGMKDPVSHDYYFKPTCLVHNFPAGAIDPVFKQCPNRTHGSNKHDHEQIQGWCKGHGRRSSLAQVYPYSFCKRLAHCIATFLQVQPQDKQSFLVSDILDTCLPSSWCLSLQEALQDRTCGQWEVLSTVTEFGVPDAVPIAVSDPVVKKLMVQINSMPSKTEILLHNESWTPYMNELGKMTLHLRKLYLPHHSFAKCSILRGTLGTAMPVGSSIEDLAFVVMWRKHDSLKQLYVVSMPSAISFPPTFAPHKWSMVMFWQSNNMHANPLPPVFDQPMAEIPNEDQPPVDPAANMPFPPQVFADPDAPIAMDFDQPLPSFYPPANPSFGNPPPDDPPGGPAPMAISLEPPFVPPADPPQLGISGIPLFEPVPNLHDMPPVPHEEEELELMDDMPDTGSVPNKRPIHPPPSDLPTRSESQRLAGDLLRHVSSPPLPPSPPKRRHVQFEPAPDDQDFHPSSSSSGPILPLSNDDDNNPLPPIPSFQPSSSSSSSSNNQPVSQPVSRVTTKKLKDNDDDDSEDDDTTSKEPTPEHFRLDDDDESDSDNTVDYGDLVKDLYIDEDEWSMLSTDHKLCSITGSFSIPRDAYGFPVDVSKTYTTQKTLRNVKQSHQQQYHQRKASRADLVEDYSNFTDEDKAIVHLCFEASGLVVGDAAHVASSAKLKKRKEASLVEKRQYAKQFAEAKQAEYQSWVDNNVFDLIDIRKSKCKNYVTGRWVLTIKRNKEGEFQKCKARWVLRGFQDRQKDSQQTDSPAATRPGFRLATQVAANNHWDLFHIDLKTAFLQGEAYDETRDIICELPKEAGLPWYTCARMKKPAYGLNDAPRRWWNIVDEKLRSYKLEPTRADRCCYVLYDSSTTKEVSRSKVPIEGPSSFDDALNYLLDPVTGSNSKNRKVLGVVCLHVDDLFLAGDAKFHAQVCQSLRRDFSIGSEDTNDIQFVGQRIKWINKDTKDSKRPQKHYIRVDQNLAIEELEEIKFDKSLKDDVAVTPSMHTEYRSVLGQINWLQSRTQFHACYKFSRCASAASSPTIGDVRALNKLVRMLRSQPVTLNFWPLEQPCRILGFPDASYKNNEDKSSQRAHCIFLASQRGKHSAHVDTYGSLVDYESHKITATTMSTTVAELYALMKCFGTCQFIRGLWADLSGESAPIHIRTDANNLVTTASTTHVPEQKETIHLIQMLRKESGSGNIEDLAHVKSEFCLSDALTKHSAKPDELIRAVETGHLRQVDVHPPFRSLLKHKAYLCLWITKFIKEPLRVVSFFGEQVHEQVLQAWCQQ